MPPGNVPAPWTWHDVHHLMKSKLRGGPLKADLIALADKYASIGMGRTGRIVTEDGWERRLYGLGVKASLDEDGKNRLIALGEMLGNRAKPHEAPFAVTRLDR